MDAAGMSLWATNGTHRHTVCACIQSHTPNHSSSVFDTHMYPYALMYKMRFHTIRDRHLKHDS